MSKKPKKRIPNAEAKPEETKIESPAVKEVPKSAFADAAGEDKDILSKLAFVLISLSFVALSSSFLLANIAGRGDPKDPPALFFVAILIQVLGFLSMIAGASMTARSRGYSGWLGGILGAIPCFGLIIVLLLPDRWKASLQTSESS